MAVPSNDFFEKSRFSYKMAAAPVPRKSMRERFFFARTLRTAARISSTANNSRKAVYKIHRLSDAAHQRARSPLAR